MTRLHLPQVTLCAVDTRTPELALRSLQRSMALIQCARVLLFTHRDAPVSGVPGVERVDIEPLQSAQAYSRFVLHDLPRYVHSTHVLITQWDGFVVDAAGWSDRYLDFDYIGAVWPDQPGHCSVGNGGFSLRSQRFLAAAQDPRITELHPEDVLLCTRYRGLLEQDYGIRFAPPELARRFAYENERPRKATFGFHGPYNLPRWLPEDELDAWLALMPDPFFSSRDARRLARALLRHGMPATASGLLKRRRACGRNDVNTRFLGVLASAMCRVSRA